MENAADLQAQLVESINTAGTIKSFGIEEYANMKTEANFITSLRTGFRSGMNGLWASTSTGIISSIFNIVLLWSGVYFVIENVISPGELLSFYALMGFFIGPIGTLVGINVVFQNARIAADRLFEIMDLDVEDIDNKIQLTEKDCGDIEFDNITFRYGSRAIIFKNFSVTFKKGNINAIVGETESGKTTLISLLQNLYELRDGHIRVGGIDIKHVDNRCLRSLIGIVPQRVDLFDGSILDNIVLDDFEPKWEKTVNVCREVGILNFIESLSDGFSTNIGENGVKLSGGQRQQLAIARVLYRDPEIIILDEATSALDSESEKRIKNVVTNLKKRRKTILLIAHRLGTVMSSDNIYVLKEGTLVEEGTHSTLIEKDGYYANFWESQTQII